MREKKIWSLRLRLSLFFGVLLLAAWGFAAVFSWLASMEHIDEFFDTQQMLFAKRLAGARYAPTRPHLPDTGDMMAGRWGDEGEQEDNVLAFAVFRPDGSLLLSDGEAGRKFAFVPGANGFVNTNVDGERWRIVWLTSLDGRVVVAVGQELEYRDDMAFELLTRQMLPWLFLLPVLLLGLTWMLNRELTPLRSVAVALAGRSPDDFTPIDVPVPSEVRPLVSALNSLFDRIRNMLQRERVFIADAAHELRTPLAGLSIQAQVAQNARQPETCAHALAQLRKGIARTSRLADQLLMLSRLESLESGRLPARIGEKLPVLWENLLRETLEEFREQAEAKGVSMSVQNGAPGAGILGQADLLRVLLGNIIGNAVKYTPEKGAITIALAGGRLVVKNSGPDISVSDAERLGERFFRPAGQDESGSGLGLSIVKKIAELHDLGIEISVAPGWFFVSVVFPEN